MVWAGSAAAAPAKSACAAVDKTAIESLFDAWNLSLASLDPDVVAQRYWPDAVLLPTVSNTPRTSTAMIRDYFVHFLDKHPRGRIDSRSIQVGCNLALDMGTYTFSVMAPTGATSEVAARYTFVYAFHDGAWKISHHHSSAMPETSGSHDPPRAAEAAAEHKSAADEKPVADDKPAVDDRAAANQPGGTRLFMNASKSPDIAQFYPGESRKKREAGDVELRVCAGPDGVLVGNPKILHSSGHERLDAAASTWVRAAKWVPATSNRRAVEGCAEVTARFRS